jgi:DNA-binding response OmpR family regulator
MWNDRQIQPNDWVLSDVSQLLREAPQRVKQMTEERRDAPLVYRVAIGREPIELGRVEFRILLLLASRPYRPFSRAKIAEAISSPLQTVDEQDVDQHILSLRDQLGFFRDYVQTVPYMGYRFKE